MSKKVRPPGAVAACAGAAILSLIGTAAYAAPDAPAEVAAAPPGAAAPGDPPAPEAKAFILSGALVSDVIGISQSGKSTPVRELDKLSITANLDLEKLVHWKGATALITFQNTSGSTPNLDLGSLQGIDNNEASVRRARIFEAWVQQGFGENASLKVGLIDMNTEFYANAASGLLIGPEFGTPSEIAATGPGGPSVFPQSSLAARLEIKPAKDLYLRVGVFNAHVGDPGDNGGVDTSFDQGVIGIAEGGWAADGKGKLALGVWGYSHKQDDVFDVNSAGDPVQHSTSGVYLISEKVLLDGGDKGSIWTGFLRAGVSDGNTGPFKGSWQLGGLVAKIIPSRADSQLSFAYDQAYIGDKYRRASAAGGTPLGTSESRFEITYSDKIVDHLLVQPDLQYIDHPGGDPHVPGAVVGMVRFTVGF
jgi:porin